MQVASGRFVNRPYYLVNSKSLCFWKPLTPGEVARKARRRGLYLYKFCPLSQLTLTALMRGPQNAVAFWGSRTEWEP